MGSNLSRKGVDLIKKKWWRGVDLVKEGGRPYQQIERVLMMHVFDGSS